MISVFLQNFIYAMSIALLVHFVTTFYEYLTKQHNLKILFNIRYFIIYVAISFIISAIFTVYHFWK